MSARDLVAVVAGVLAEDDHQASCAGYDDDARYLLTKIHEAGWRIVKPTAYDPHHVTFRDGSWAIEHSVACRNTGAMLHCGLHYELSRGYEQTVPNGRYVAQYVDGGWDLVSDYYENWSPKVIAIESEWTPDDAP
jgi:hypothetical protein